MERSVPDTDEIQTYPAPTEMQLSVADVGTQDGKSAKRFDNMTK